MTPRIYANIADAHAAGFADGRDGKPCATPKEPYLHVVAYNRGYREGQAVARGGRMAL